MTEPVVEQLAGGEVVVPLAGKESGSGASEHDLTQTATVLPSGVVVVHLSDLDTRRGREAQFLTDGAELFLDELRSQPTGRVDLRGSSGPAGKRRFGASNRTVRLHWSRSRGHCWRIP
jgi:hypothetical protein